METIPFSDTVFTKEVASLCYLKFLNWPLTYVTKTLARGFAGNLMWFVVPQSICFDSLVTVITGFDFSECY